MHTYLSHLLVFTENSFWNIWVTFPRKIDSWSLSCPELDFLSDRLVCGRHLKGPRVCLGVPLCVCRIFLLHSMDFPPAGVFPIRSFLCPHHEEEGKPWVDLLCWCLVFGEEAAFLCLSGIVFPSSPTSSFSPHFPGFLFPLFISSLCAKLILSCIAQLEDMLVRRGPPTWRSQFCCLQFLGLSPGFIFPSPLGPPATFPARRTASSPSTCYASLTMRWYKKLLAINQLSLFNYLAHFAIYPLLATDTPKKSAILAQIRGNVSCFLGTKFKLGIIRLITWYLNYLTKFLLLLNTKILLFFRLNLYNLRLLVFKNAKKTNWEL